MTSNPMINNRVVENVILEGEPMTITGAVNKTLILSSIVIVTSSVVWYMASIGLSDKVTMLGWIGIIAGFILALVTSFKPQNSNVTAPCYALCEGLFIGGISYAYNSLYNGIVVNAFFATLISLFAMLLLYKTRLIQATPTFQKVIFASTMAIAIYYLISLIGSFFGYNLVASTFATPLGIGVSIVVCIIASLNFILDFNFIEQSSQRMLPKYFEWYGAFTLLVTVVWLYIEILRLLAQLNSRR